MQGKVDDLTADKPVEKVMTRSHQVVDQKGRYVDMDTVDNTNERMKQHELPVMFNCSLTLWHGIIEPVFYMPGELSA
jgi:hypothetical protein